ncbi:hypothetical protein B0O99DRAFT_608258 [Bisporella sp. PMI_857]|nr:hypothetical protein B0O99DRAFT_608258 [Bisporella sp. PMI_857]
MIATLTRPYSRLNSPNSVSMCAKFRSRIPRSSLANMSEIFCDLVCTVKGRGAVYTLLMRCKNKEPSLVILWS